MAALRERVVSFVGTEGTNPQEDALSGLFTVREIDAAYTIFREMVLAERKIHTEATAAKATIEKKQSSRAGGTKEATAKSRTTKPPESHKIIHRRNDENVKNVNSGVATDSLEEDDDENDDEEEHAGDTEDDDERISPSDLDDALDVVQSTEHANNPPLSPESTHSAPLPPQHPSSSAKKKSKHAAFNEYTNTQGVAMANNLKAAKIQQRDVKAKVKKEIDVANVAKKRIDGTLLKLEAYRQKQEDIRQGGRGILEDEEGDTNHNSNHNYNGESVMDAEEFELLKEVKHWKRQYRAAASHVGPLKQQLVFLGTFEFYFFQDTTASKFVCI